MTRLAYYVVPYYRIYSNSPYTRNMYHACGWLRDFLLFVSHRLCAPFICYRCYFLASYAYIFKQILSIWIRVKLQEPTENRARERERERDLKERGGGRRKRKKNEKSFKRKNERWMKRIRQKNQQIQWRSLRLTFFVCMDYSYKRCE